MKPGSGRLELSSFRTELYAAMPRRADALFELTDAVLRAGGPVVSPPELSLEQGFSVVR